MKARGDKPPYISFVMSPSLQCQFHMKTRGDKPPYISFVVDLTAVDFWEINEDEGGMTLSQVCQDVGNEIQAFEGLQVSVCNIYFTDFMLCFRINKKLI